MSGEHFYLVMFAISIFGSSPRERGAPDMALTDYEQFRIIPA